MFLGYVTTQYEALLETQPVPDVIFYYLVFYVALSLIRQLIRIDAETIDLLPLKTGRPGVVMFFVGLYVFMIPLMYLQNYDFDARTDVVIVITLLVSLLGLYRLFIDRVVPKVVETWVRNGAKGFIAERGGVEQPNESAINAYVSADMTQHTIAVHKYILDFVVVVILLYEAAGLGWLPFMFMLIVTSWFYYLVDIQKLRAWHERSVQMGRKYRESVK